MLWVSNDITQYTLFKSTFKSRHESLPWMDISTVPLQDLMNQCESILSHHPAACVFLGYLEPGWMLDTSHQTRLRALFRKYPVGFVCHFPQSLPFSWKNEIEVWYPLNPKHSDGTTDAVHNGGSVHHESQV
jgi:hypothetical protein